jgi:two-component system, NarL family, sensor histidine kinase UhpB
MLRFCCVLVALAVLGPSASSDTGPLLDATRMVAIGLGVATLSLSVLLYVLPLRAAEMAKRRTQTAMTERVLTFQEEDRRRIARDLHDGAGQALTAARLQLIALRTTDGVPRDVVEQIIANVDGAMDEIRRSTSALVPPALGDLGLRGALVRHCENLASASGMEVRLDAPASLPPLPAYVETAIYRIAQEGLTNAARHAGAQNAWLTLIATEDGIRLEVGDDGAGIDPAKRGFGFESIDGRARLAGGALEVVGSPGPGTRLRVTIPLMKGVS